MKKIPLFYPFIPYKEVMTELKDTLSGKMIGQAHKVDEFEEKFGKKYGYKYPLFINSATSGLELAYHLIGLQKGDEVIVPVLDCAAGQMGLVRLGVKVVFSDIGSNLNVDVNDVLLKITPKTKAIIAVNLGGIQVNPKLYKESQKRNIPVITDSAQHLGHTKGDYIVYSFQAIKHITTGDGGMLILKDKKTYDRAKKLRWFGIDREKKIKDGQKSWETRQMTFDIEEAGFKYQPTDIDACLGLAGLKYADKIIAHNKLLVEEYKKLPIPVIAGGSFWLCGICTPKRNRIAKHLIDNGVETNVIHTRNDILTVLGGIRQNLPMMNKLEDKYLYLPLNHKITIKDVKKICKLIVEAL